MNLPERKQLQPMISNLAKKGKLNLKGPHGKQNPSAIHEGDRVIIKEKENFKLIVEPKK